MAGWHRTYHSRNCGEYVGSRILAAECTQTTVWSNRQRLSTDVGPVSRNREWRRAGRCPNCLPLR